MRRLIIALLLVVVLITTPAFAGGLLYQGDDQQLKVRNSAGTHSSALNPDGTLDLDGTVLAPAAITQIGTNTASIGSIETNLATGPTAIALGSVENSIDQIRSVSLPGKMALVTSPSAEVMLKMNAQGQAVAAGFNDGNVFLIDGTRGMAGDLNMSSSHKIVNLQNGVNPTDAINKSQLDSALAGLSWQPEVNEVKNTSVGLIGPVVAGYRVLVLGVTAGDFAAHTNEIATRNVANDGWTFQLPSAHWALFDGNLNQGWVYSADSSTWVQFSGADNFTPGDALSKSGNLLNVRYNDTTIGLNGSNQLCIKATSIGDGLIAANAAIAEGKLSLSHGTQDLYDFINNHTSSVSIHRSIDDSATTSTTLWSATKIHAEDEAYLAIVNAALSGKAATVHAHAVSDITGFAAAVRGNVSASGAGIAYNSGTGAFSLVTAEIDIAQLYGFNAANYRLQNDATTSSTTLWSSQHTADAITAALAAFSQINDGTTSSTTLWSSSHVNDVINAGLALKANAVHGHAAAEITGLDAETAAYLNSTAQVVLAGGKDQIYAGEKTAVSAGSAVAFANVGVGSVAYATLEVTGTLFGSAGKAVANGKWLVMLRKVAAGNVAVASVQQVFGDESSAVPAELAFAAYTTTLTAVATNGTTVALKMNTTMTGSDSVSQYGVDYSIHVMGVGVTSITGQ